MLEANTQEYAFNFLQQSLKNRIDDTEVCVCVCERDRPVSSL